MVKVLCITSRADIGGGSKVVHDLATFFNGIKNIEMFIASPDNYHYSKIYKQVSQGFVPIGHRTFSFFSFLRLLVFVLKNKIDIVHSHGRGAGYYSRLLKICRVKVVHSFHGVHKRDELTFKIKILIDRLLIYFTDEFICVSGQELKLARAMKIINTNYQVINNGVDGSTYKIKDETLIARFRDQFKCGHQQIILGTLSRLDYQKGNDILLNHFYKLKEHCFDKYKLVIAGSGEEECRLRDLVSKLSLEKDIIFLGDVDDSKNFLHAIDIFVSCSRGEGMPIAVLEALATGTPVVLSKVSGHTDIVGVSNTFELEDFKSFESYIENAAKCSEIALDDKFEINNVASAYHNMYLELSGSSAIDIKLYENIEDVKEDWLCLEQKLCGLPFQTFKWCSCWYETVGVKENCTFVAAAVSDILFAPFIIYRKLGVKILTIMGGNGADYFAPFGGCSHRVFLLMLRKIKLLYNFDIFFVPRTLELIEGKVNTILAGNNVFLFFESSHQFVLTANDWKSVYQSNIKSKVRSDITRQSKRLNELGALNYHVASTESDASHIMKTLMEQKMQRHQYWKVPTIFTDDNYRDFYHKLGEASCNESKNFRAHISSLMLNGKRISTHFGVSRNDTFYYMLPAIDLGDFQKYSPGKIHLFNLLKESHSEGCRVFDFTIGDEGYKKYWSNQESLIYTVYRTFSFTGYIYLQMMNFKGAINSNPKLRDVVLKVLFYLKR